MGPSTPACCAQASQATSRGGSRLHPPFTSYNGLRGLGNRQYRVMAMVSKCASPQEPANEISQAGTAHDATSTLCNRCRTTCAGPLHILCIDTLGRSEPQTEHCIPQVAQSSRAAPWRRPRPSCASSPSQRPLAALVRAARPLTRCWWAVKMAASLRAMGALSSASGAAM
jgi:hypothetical protein